MLEGIERNEPINWQRDYMLIKLLAYSGRRVTEVLSLKYEDVIPERGNHYGKISFNILKKKEKIDGKWIPRDMKRLKDIDSKVFKELVSYIKWMRIGPGDYIFGSTYKPDNHLTDRRIRQIVKKYANLSGIKSYMDDNGRMKDPHPHMFRHGFAIDVAKNAKTTADLLKLQKALEHSNFSITSFYLQFSDTEQKEVFEGRYKEGKLK